MPHFKKHYDDLAFYLGDDASGDTLTAAKAAINRAYYIILSEVKQDSLRRVFTLTTRVGEAEYGMPLYVREILNIEDPDKTPGALREISAFEWDRRFGDRTVDGDAEEYFQQFDRGVQRQPAAAGVLTAVSDVTTDSSNRFVRFTGFTAAGDLITDRVTMAGTTDADTTKTFGTEMERIVKSTNAGFLFTGVVTIKDASGNTLASIPSWVDSPTYKWIRLNYTPDSVKTYNVRCLMRKPPLVNDDDWPDFNEEFHDLLLYVAGKEILPHYGKTEQADRFAVFARERMKKFKDLASPRANRELVFDDVTLRTSRHAWPWWPQSNIVES